MFRKSVKGDYKYLYNKKIKVIVLTLLYFAVALGIFAIGYITTGTKRNLLTIVAVLGLLPASKSAVSMIMYIMSRGCSETLYSKIEANKGKALVMYDMYFTSYSKNFALSAMVVLNSVVIAVTEDAKCDINEATKHLSTMLGQAGYKTSAITITNDADKFISMLTNINEIDDEVNEKDESIRIALYEICL